MLLTKIKKTREEMCKGQHEARTIARIADNYFLRITVGNVICLVFRYNTSNHPFLSVQDKSLKCSIFYLICWNKRKPLFSKYHSVLIFIHCPQHTPKNYLTKACRKTTKTLEISTLSTIKNSLVSKRKKSAICIYSVINCPSQQCHIMNYI